MTNQETLKAITDVYFHASCPDGTSAAMICAAAFMKIGKKDVKFHSLQYQTADMMNLVPAPGQLFVDITPPMNRWEEWIPFNPVVLDHHETAKAATIGLNGVYGLNETHSGAMLAFDFVYKILCPYDSQWLSDDALWYEIAHTAMIRDTWKETHPDWKEASAQAEAFSFFGSKKMLDQVYSETPTFDYQKFMEIGRMIREKSEKRAVFLAEGAWHNEIEVLGEKYKVAVFNCTEKMMVSDTSHVLLDRGVDIAVSYFNLFQDGEVRYSYSLRTKDRVSARAIAQVYGGGGHNQAAGFRMACSDAPKANKVHLLIAKTLEGLLASDVSVGSDSP